MKITAIRIALSIVPFVAVICAGCNRTAEDSSVSAQMDDALVGTWKRVYSDGTIAKYIFDSDGTLTMETQEAPPDDEISRETSRWRAEDNVLIEEISDEEETETWTHPYLIHDNVLYDSPYLRRGGEEHAGIFERATTQIETWTEDGVQIVNTIATQTINIHDGTFTLSISEETVDEHDVTTEWGRALTGDITWLDNGFSVVVTACSDIGEPGDSGCEFLLNETFTGCLVGGGAAVVFDVWDDDSDCGHAGYKKQ
ncbi:MAG: hypothetical protein JXX14_11895 [Deltaproteobacteria bacterium]|nr:hypothetical protein [Deltaproteobacteria bacterium]